MGPPTAHSQQVHRTDLHEVPILRMYGVTEAGTPYVLYTSPFVCSERWPNTALHHRASFILWRLWLQRCRACRLLRHSSVQQLACATI